MQITSGRLYLGSKKEEIFYINSRHYIPQQISHYPQYFENCIQMQEEWAQKIISHHKHNLIKESLRINFQLHSPLITTTGGGKEKKKRGGR